MIDTIKIALRYTYELLNSLDNMYMQSYINTKTLEIGTAPAFRFYQPENSAFEFISIRRKGAYIFLEGSLHKWTTSNQDLYNFEPGNNFNYVDYTEELNQIPIFWKKFVEFYPELSNPLDIRLLRIDISTNFSHHYDEALLLSHIKNIRMKGKDVQSQRNGISSGNGNWKREIIYSKTNETKSVKQLKQFNQTCNLLRIETQYGRDFLRQNNYRHLSNKFDQHLSKNKYNTTTLENITLRSIMRLVYNTKKQHKLEIKSISGESYIETQQLPRPLRLLINDVREYGFESAKTMYKVRTFQHNKRKLLKEYDIDLTKIKQEYKKITENNMTFSFQEFKGEFKRKTFEDYVVAQ
jgi:hypothetical protein